jgi:hypothetical protein
LLGERPAGDVLGATGVWFQRFEVALSGNFELPGARYLVAASGDRFSLFAMMAIINWSRWTWKGRSAQDGEIWKQCLLYTYLTSVCFA